MNKPSYAELVRLLARSHQKLEQVTNRVGCGMETAIVLVDCENALKQVVEKSQRPHPQSMAGHVH